MAMIPISPERQIRNDIYRACDAERERQISKGYNAAHDDDHGDGEIAGIAAAVASGMASDAPYLLQGAAQHILEKWPGYADRIRIAHAMLTADLERLARATGQPQPRIEVARLDPDTLVGIAPCDDGEPGWVRLASEDAEKERVWLARLVTYPDTLTGPYTREEVVAQAGLWWARRADFWFAGMTQIHDSMDHKMDVPKGARVFSLFEFRGDNRAWISLDGNWNHDAAPIDPPMTYDEAFAFLSRCAVAPPWLGRCEKVEPNAKPVGYGSKRDTNRGLASRNACVVRGLHLTATGD